MSDPLQKKLRKKANKAQRRALEETLEANGYNAHEKNHAKTKRR
jgi:hypothetical protein